MQGYNVEKRKVLETIQQLYRDFALQYSVIQKSSLSKREKQIEITKLTEKTKQAEQVLRNSSSLSGISSEDRESLGIKETDNPEVDENVVNTLVSIYAKRAKIPNEKNRNTGILRALTLREDETSEEIDTTAFEEELRQYFTEHYFDLFATGYNSFLSEITHIPDDFSYSDKYGDLAKMAIIHGIEPEKFHCFGYGITVQDGLVAEENFTETNIFYATPDGINKRIFDLYSEILYRERANGRDSYSDDTRKLKNAYITYAEKNGIEITNPDVSETIEIDMAKVQGLARYINRVVNEKAGIEKGDYTQLFQDDIIKNYSKIMNLQSYSFGNLDSVRKIARQPWMIDDLHLKLDKDSITTLSKLDIAYGTPEFIRQEYQRIMQQVEALHQTNAFLENDLEIEKITTKKQAYRRYIQENGIEGIDISIPEVEIDHDRTGMIADAIMQQYGKDYEDAENMRSRILAKLEDNWAEIVTEAQVIYLSKLFGEELKEMGQQFPREQLYVKDDFVYLGNYDGYTSNVIYATQEALTENLKALDRKIASTDSTSREKKIRESLVKYANEQGFDLDIPSVESVENREKKESEMSSFGGGFSRWGTERMPDDPIARPNVELEDSISEAINKISEKIPGVIVLLAQLMQADDAGIILLLDLDDMNIRGSQIRVAYENLYNKDGKKFAEAIKNRDEKMVQFINEELASVGGEKAVTGGASKDRSKTPNKYRFTEEEVIKFNAQREKRMQKQGNAANERTEGSRQRLEILQELDDQLTELKDKEREVIEECGEYERKLPVEPHK